MTIIGKIKVIEVQRQVAMETARRLQKYAEMLSQGAFAPGSQERMTFSPNMTLIGDGFVVGCQLCFANPSDLQFKDGRYLVEALNEHLHDDDDDHPKWIQAILEGDQISFSY